ncbi:MAG: Flp family type IVb pilin [Deltaproteobacteria bacterium]|nr:MAG: Flp family type IVb pilin [Deltaproteobacteria bacterium]
MAKIKNFLKEESGVSSVEYVIMAALATVLVLAGIETFCASLSGLYAALGDSFQELIS